MFKAIGFFLRLPWQALLGLAVALCVIGYDSYDKAKDYEQEKAQALADGLPAPVPLDRFTEDDVHPASEVHVTGWINTDYNYELTKQRRGADTVQRMFVLFGPGDQPNSKVARAVVLIDPDRMDDFMGMLLAGLTDVTDARMPFTLNGRYGKTPALSDMVEDALKEKGLQKDADFFALTPFLDGREAALAANPDAPMNALKLFAVLALVCVILAMRNYRQFRQEPMPVRRSLAEVEIPPVGAPIPGFGPVARPAPAAQVASTLPPPGSGEWSPLEAVRAKQMQPQPTVAPMRTDGWESPIKSAPSGGWVRKAMIGLLAVPIFGFASMILDRNDPPVVVQDRAATEQAGAGAVDRSAEASVGAAGDEAGADVAVMADRASGDAPAAPVGVEGAQPASEEGEGIYWAPTSLGENALFFFLTLAAAVVLRFGLSQWGRRTKRASGRDPWDRLSERLR